MRIGYSEDEDYPGQFGLWQANCNRSLKGKAGQAALRELEAALLALPDKRLTSGVYKDEDGCVCPLAALAKYKGVADADLQADPEYDMEQVGVELGVPRLAAWKIVELNDLQLSGTTLIFGEGPYRWPSEQPYAYVPITPEQRYERVLQWVQEQLR